MADISTVWNVQAGAGDWVAIPGDLQGGDDLETAVLISLFTDRLAEPSDVIPDGTGDRRGWWGDIGQDYPIGSRFWLLARAKQIPATLQAAQGYGLEALAWMIADEVVASTTVTCSWIGQGVMGVRVGLYRQDGSVLASYAWAWTQLGAS